MGRRVLIAGAGIGGSATAIALDRAGFEVVLLEAASDPAVTAIGGGFHIWANASRALELLGLGEVARSRAEPLSVTEFCNARGRLLARWPVAQLSGEVGGTDLGFSRRDLLQMLHAALPTGSLVADARVTGFVDDGQEVTVQLANGDEVRGDVLVGADGLRSVIREQLLGSGDPEYAGYVQWQTVIDGGHELFPAGEERIIFGPGTRTVMHRVADGRLYWTCVTYGPQNGGGTPDGRKQRLLDAFRGWPDPIETAIDATPEGQLVGVPVFDRTPVSRWGAGRVTILGDAAHPMTTNTSQGGNQAIEDAVVLARFLSGGADTETALREFEESRIARTSPLVENSRWIAGLGAWRSRPRVLLRDTIFRFGLPTKGVADLRAAIGGPL